MGFLNAGDEQFRCHEASLAAAETILAKRRRRLGKGRGKSA